jgi:thiamine-phosphate pyrophosphorylase
MTKQPGLISGLYLVANFYDDPEDVFLSKIKDALEGGVDMVQLRAKALNEQSFLKLALSVKRLCEEKQKLLIINDNVTVALRASADGVHLGHADLAIHKARDVLGKQAIIGRSVACNEPLTRELESADYLAASPVLSSRTKPDAGYPFGLDGLRKLLLHAKLPVVAIGGITTENARSILETGCRSLAVVSAIMESTSPNLCAREFKRIMGEYHA